MTVLRTSLQFLASVGLKKNVECQRIRNVERYLSIFINPRGVWKISTFLTILFRRTNSPSLSCPFIILFALLPRPRVAFRRRRCAADITICNFIQRRYRGYIACYGHFSHARRCRPLGVMTRKKSMCRDSF